jgi:dipeptidyl aminopeptidase/acylaminoacyl peptidase
MAAPNPKPTLSPRPLTVDTLLQLQRVGAVALSPAGDQAVCAVATPDLARNSMTTALWRLDTGLARARRLTTAGDRDGQPAWSPRGDRIAFVARRHWRGALDKAPQLYLIAPDGGEAERASDFAPGVESFKWLPDGRRIVFAAWVWPGLNGAAAQNRRQRTIGERKETGYATSEAFYRYWDRHLPQGRVLHLLLLDTRSGRVADLFEGTALELPRHGGSATDYDVHPDGCRIAFVHDPAATQVLGNRCALSEIDLATRRVEPLVDDEAWDLGAPRYRPDGAAIAFAAAEVARHHLAPARLAVRDVAGRWQALGADWDHEVDAPLRWSADGRALHFTAQARGRRHLWRHDLASGAFEIAHVGGWVQGFDLAGDTLLVAADAARHPVRVHARRGAAPMRRIETFNDAVLARTALGEVREIAVRGAQGDPVQVWLSFPPGFDARLRHAVTHVIHGGPFGAAGDTFSYRWNPHLLASQGAVVAQVNFHGSSGFGFDFKRSLVGRQGALELQDIEAATDWLQRQRWVDPQRIVATGGSYGGFLVAWMNGHVAPGRYQAYVCHAGVFDRVATFSADSYPVRPKDLGANYWDDLARVLAQSPMAFAGTMRTPTLVIHGAKDYRVSDCNALAYYNTLQARGVPARLLWFPDENHWVLKPYNARQWYREFLDWVGRHTTLPGRAPRSGASLRPSRPTRSSRPRAAEAAR